MIMDQWKYFERYAYGPPIFPEITPPTDTELIVVLPSYKEPQLLQAVRSLTACKAPGFKVWVLIVVNEPEQAEEAATDLNQQAIRQLDQLEIPDFMELVVYHAVLPRKKAGVGLARKLGMDEAARWFNEMGKDGIITCYDADCLCDPRFFQVIEETFRQQQLGAGVIFYEHPLSNNEIIQYELFLRYHIDALRFAEFPYAYQTLGSCISVRSSVYQKHGGMNTRKAGEDFYFLHKIIPHCKFGEINNTMIYPSARESDRVPFGTGIALAKISQLEQYEVYAPESFVDLKALFSQVEQLHEHQEVNLPETIVAFHEEHGFEVALKEMHRNASNRETFKKRFFSWWDAFRALKYVHFTRDHHYPNIPLEEAIQWLDVQYWKLGLEGTMEDKLVEIRDWDQGFDKLSLTPK
ncbi:MAG: hypothetical protein R8G66_05550 [Cytophagales bacterium]|nr:hypothetical protein [Cytophagales bacterium]